MQILGWLVGCLVGWLVGWLWLVKLLVGWNQSAFQTLLGFVRQGGVGGGGLKQGTGIS